MKEGILLCGHGSRKTAGVEEFKKLVEILKDRYKTTFEVDYGFLEFNHPLFEAAVERLYSKGIRTIYALPVILFAGAHAKNDIPYELNTIQSYYPDLKIKMGSPIGVNTHVLELAKKRIEETELTLPPIDRKETCLVVVGRGTTDPDANSDVNKLMSMLWEGMGFGFATTAYSGTAYPSVDQSLNLVEKLGFKRTIVIPFFFFTGVLLDRIHSVLEEKNNSSSQEFIYTSPFGTDELMLKAFDDRLDEVMNGAGNMNCQLCKYRKQIIGFEEEVGKEQIGHHLNVKGVLFEEDEKIGEKKSSLGSSLKKLLGI
jgi:sirohydrochlorin cobaltochelatase